MNPASPVDIAAPLSLGMVLLALALSLVRFALGPSLPDRVVALDTIVALIVGFVAAWVVLTGESVFIDAVIVLVMVAFLATVAIARALERGTR